MWALVPVKRLATSKSRLAAELSLAQRAELTYRMLEDVLHALRCAQRVKKIIVLSNEPDISSALAGVERFPEAQEGDINRSLRTAIADLPETAGRVLVLPADIPGVAAADIDALGETRPDRVVLSPAIVDGGTNALVSPLPLGVPLCYGDRSFVCHLRAARRRGVAVEAILRPGLARDVDRPEDLVWLADPRQGGRAAAYVRSLRRQFSEREAG